MIICTIKRTTVPDVATMIVYIKCTDGTVRTLIKDRYKSIGVRNLSNPGSVNPHICKV